MRLTTFLLLCVVLQVCAADGLSQGRITLSKKDVSLVDLFKDLRRQSGYDFLYSNRVSAREARVSLDVRDMPIDEVMDLCLKGLPLTYQIVDRTVIVRPMAESGQGTFPSFVVKGKVTDASGAPLAGVTVMVKNSRAGTITDQDGNYSVTVDSGGETLVFSYVGFTQKEIPVDGLSQINVVLSQSASSLDQLVVIGYGTEKKKDLTGAISTISSKEIENRIVPNLANALQGADPSLNITFGTGIPGGSYDVDVRGVPSINGGSPLIIADGIEVNLNEINPQDIKSISILKDAAAQAIYGAKASSGVVLITTKDGAGMAGKSQITFMARTGVASNTTSTDFIRTGYDHVKLVNEFYNIYKGSDMAVYSDDDMQLLEDRRHDMKENPDRPWTIVNNGKYYYYGNTDWYGYFYRRNRPQQEYNISARGGTDKVNYYTSGRYWSQDGLFNIYNDKFRNYSFFTKVNAEIQPWLHYTGSLSYNSSVYKYGGFYDEQQTINALQSNILSSFVPRNPDGTIVQYTNQLSANSPIGAGFGGFLTANTARNSKADNYIVLSNQFDFDITKHIDLTVLYAFRKESRMYKYRDMPFDYSRQQGVVQTFTSGTIYDFYQEQPYQLNDHNVNVYATYDKHFGINHHLTVVAGSQFEDYRSDALSVKKTDLLSEDLSSFSVATGDATITQNIGAFRTLGFFGRANYDYKGKYLLEMSGRFDGTSRFAPSDRWGFFPSASLGWRMSEENFWKPLKNMIEDAKLRLSVGSLGNQQVDDYAYIDEISPTNQMNYTFDGATKASYASVSNPISSSLTWETITTQNIGLDLTTLNDRLNFSGNYFIRNTRNMLAQSLTLPAVFGANTPLGNVANLRTNGWDITLQWNSQFTVRNKPLHYNVAITLGDYISTITRYNNPDKLISDYYVGMRLGEIWGYKIKGLFKTDADAAAYQSKIDDKAVNLRVYNSAKENNLEAGDVEFLDLNNDGIINQGSGTVSDPGDERVIGNSQPRYNYSIRLGGDWAGIDVSVFLQGVGQRNWFPTTYAYDFWGPYSFPSLSFIPKDFLKNTWSTDHPDAYFPKPRGYASYSSGALGVTSDRYLQNVAYLRLKNLTIGYTLPLGKKGAPKIRIYASGENLYYWSPLKKHSKTVDPELTVTSSTYYSDSGVGYSFPKTYNAGVNITF